MDENCPLRLRKRAEFLAVQRKGIKQRGSLFLMEVLEHDKLKCNEFEHGKLVPKKFKSSKNRNPKATCSARVGFTVSKKNGNAVKRNRIRRRLREAVREIAKDCLKAGTDYVIVARPDCLTVSYDRLKGELKRRFEKINIKESRSRADGI